MAILRVSHQVNFIISEPETWSTVARSGSPRPAPSGDAAPSSATVGDSGKPGVSEEEKRRIQDELLVGVGARLGSGEPRSASG